MQTLYSIGTVLLWLLIGMLLVDFYTLNRLMVVTMEIRFLFTDSAIGGGYPSLLNLKL